MHMHAHVHMACVYNEMTGQSQEWSVENLILFRLRYTSPLKPFPFLRVVILLPQ